MDRLNNDYSYWRYFETWHVADAWKIIKYYNYEIMSDQSEQDKQRTLRQWKSKFDRDAEMFAYDIVWVDVMNEDVPAMDDLRDYIPSVGEMSKVDKNEFIKWAYSERIPLPPEIMDLVKHNWEKGELKPNSEMSEADYSALSKLPCLKRTIIELREHVLVLKASIYGATRAPWLFLSGKYKRPISKEEFMAEFRSDGRNTPDDLILKIYDSLPIGLTRPTDTLPPEEIT